MYLPYFFKTINICMYLPYFFKTINIVGTKIVSRTYDLYSSIN